MNLHKLFLNIYDDAPSKRYLAYKQTALINGITEGKRGAAYGFYCSEIGSFKVLCKKCYQHIGNGKVARIEGGWNFLVSCRCTKGIEKKFSATEKEMRRNESLAIAYLKLILAGEIVRK